MLTLHKTVLSGLLASSFFASHVQAQTVPDPCRWQGLDECRDRALVCQGTSDDSLTANNWPVSGDGQPDKLVSAFGPRNRGADGFDYHEGVDIRTWRNGAAANIPVFASWRARVERITAPCWDDGGPDCATLLHSLVLRHPGPNDVFNDDDDFFSNYVHFDPWMPWDGVSDPTLLPYWPYRDLYVGKDIDPGFDPGNLENGFVYSGDTGADAIHLHYGLMVGGSNVARHSINPMRMNAINYSHRESLTLPAVPAFSEEQATPLTQCVVNDASALTTLSFTAFTSAYGGNTASCPFPCLEQQLDLNKVLLKAPIFDDHVLVDFDRHINDDSQGDNAEGPGEPGQANEEGIVCTGTKFGFSVGIRMRPEDFSYDDTQKRIEFAFTVPKPWLCLLKKSLPAYLTVCDTWSALEASEQQCSEHCRTMPLYYTGQAAALAGGGGLSTAAEDDCGEVVAITTHRDGDTVPAGRTAIVKVQVAGGIDLADSDVRLEVNGVSQTFQSRLLTEWTFAWAVPAGAGVEYQLQALATIGGAEVPSEVVRVRSVEGLTVEITSPSNGHVVPPDTDLPVAVATEAQQSVYLLLNNSGGNRWMTETSPGQYAYTIPKADFADGQNTIAARVVGYNAFDEITVTATAVIEPPQLSAPSTAIAGTRVPVFVFAPGATAVTVRVGGFALPLQERRFATWTFEWAVPGALGTYTIVAEVQYSGRPPRSLSVTSNVVKAPDMRITNINRYAFLGRIEGIKPPDPRIDGPIDTPIQVPADAYTCAVVGYAARGGDIEESDGILDGIPDFYWDEIVQAHLYKSGTTWTLRTGFRTGNYHWLTGEFDPRPETTDVDILCVSSQVASLRTFTAPDPGPFDTDTGIRVDEQACGIAGFNSGKGDINETDVRDIIEVYPYRAGGTWHIRSSFSTHHDQDDESRRQNWTVNLICLNRSVASLDTVVPDKPFFIREYRGPNENGMGDNVTHSIDVATRDYACGVVGFAARDGDIDEGEKGGGDRLMWSFMTDVGGTWHFRGDFRTHGNHENWDNVNVLCALKESGTPPAWNVSRRETGFGGCMSGGFECQALPQERINLRGGITLAGGGISGTPTATGLRCATTDDVEVYVDDRDANGRPLWSWPTLCLRSGQTMVLKSEFTYDFRGVSIQGATARPFELLAGYVPVMQGAVAQQFPAPYGPGIALTWTPTSLPGAAFYEIQYSVDGRDWYVYRLDREVSHGGWVNHVGNTVFGSFQYALPSGQTYFYRVRVLDAARSPISGWSNVIAGTVQRYGNAPVMERADTTLFPAPWGPGVALGWTATTLAQARFYHVQYSVDGEHWLDYTRERDVAYGGWINHHGSIQHGDYVYALPSGQKFFYRVRVLDPNRVPMTPWSNVVTGAVERYGDDPVMEGAVATAFPAPYGPGIALSWEPTALAGAAYYEIEYSVDGERWSLYRRDREVSYGGWVNHHGDVQLGDFTYALPSGQTYLYRVRVRDHAQNPISGWSNVIRGTVERYGPAPVLQGAAATRFPAPYGPGIALVWTPTTLPAARFYHVQYSTDGQQWVDYTRDRDVAHGGWINHHGSVTFDQYLYALPSGQRYFYRVQVLDGGHQPLSPWSNQLTGRVAYPLVTLAAPVPPGPYERFGSTRVTLDVASFAGDGVRLSWAFSTSGAGRVSPLSGWCEPGPAESAASSRCVVSVFREGASAVGVRAEARPRGDAPDAAPAPDAPEDEVTVVVTAQDVEGARASARIDLGFQPSGGGCALPPCVPIESPVERAR